MVTAVSSLALYLPQRVSGLRLMEQPPSEYQWSLSRRGSDYFCRECRMKRGNRCVELWQWLLKLQLVLITSTPLSLVKGSPMPIW